MSVIQPNGIVGWTCARCGAFVTSEGPHFCGTLQASPYTDLATATATALVNLFAEREARIAELEAELVKFRRCEECTTNKAGLGTYHKDGDFPGGDQ